MYMVAGSAGRQSRWDVLRMLKLQLPLACMFECSRCCERAAAHGGQGPLSNPPASAELHDAAADGEKGGPHPPMAPQVVRGRMGHWGC